jgi:hypothetical protein
MTKTAATKETALTTTAPAGAIAQINPEYLQPLELPRQGYPTLQANKYKDISSDSKLSIGFAQKSVDMMPTEVYDAFGFEIIEVDFDNGKGIEPFFVPSPQIRWVPLAFPTLWIEDKSDPAKSVFKHRSADFGAKCKTTCRLFMAALLPSGDALISDIDGKPQVIVVSFKGLRTDERIFGSSEGTLLSLNNKLLQKYKIKDSRYMGHLVSVELGIKVSKYASKKDATLKSNGADIFFTGSAKLLPDNLQAMTTAMVRLDHQLKAAIKDPYNLSGGAEIVDDIDGDFPF